MAGETPKLLPHAVTAVIDPAKNLRYLLDSTNPNNRGKAAIFSALGYERESWEQLREDLLTHGRVNSVVRAERQGDATVYIIDGVLVGPNSRSRRFRTIWRQDAGSQHSRLITAFPAPSERTRA